MSSLRDKLPPLGTFLAFEAAARHLSFTLAAEELGVSQAAVSRQIRSLEDHLGTPMFRRLHRAVRLTPAGDRLQAALTMGLGHIAETVEGLRRSRSASEVVVCTTIAFAAFWLMPRIGRFHSAEPDVELKLIAAEQMVNLGAEGIDLGVRYGDGNWPDVTAVRMFDDEIFPVCSRGYLKGRPPLKTPTDLLGETLLHQEVADRTWIPWRAWLERVGIEPPRKLPGPTFNNHVILIQACQDGQGIALGWRRLAEPLIKSGALVRPIEVSFRPSEAFYLVAPRSGAHSPEGATFRDWILAEAAAEA